MKPRVRSVLFTNPPLSGERVFEQIQPREAITEAPDLELKTSLILPGHDVSVAQVSVPGAAIPGSGGETAKSHSVEVQVVFKPARLGVRAFPPSVEGELIDPPDLVIVKQEEQRLLKKLRGNTGDATPQQLQELEDAIAARIRAIPTEATDPYIPGHLPLRPVPEPLPKKLEAPKFFDPQFQSVSADIPRATTLFAPEDRQILWDTSYPWGTNGRVTTGNGQGSGVLVGPRHLLTCSHVVVWNADGTSGWVDFVPGYFDMPPGPFGSASAIHYYAHRKVTGPTLDVDESRHDYCVFVLNWRIGDVAGWMGSKSYTDSWDGNAWWTLWGSNRGFWA